MNGFARLTPSLAVLTISALTVLNVSAQDLTATNAETSASNALTDQVQAQETQTAEVSTTVPNKAPSAESTLTNGALHDAKPSIDTQAQSSTSTPLTSRLQKFEVNINPVNGFIGNQYMYNAMYVVRPDVAFGPAYGFDKLKSVDEVNADSIKEYALGIRMERAPAGFSTDGYYSSIALDILKIKTQSESTDCKGSFLGYGGTFLAGYSVRENPFNLILKFGAGLHTSMYLNPIIKCDDGSKLNIRKATDYVKFTPVLELSMGYSI